MTHSAQFETGLTGVANSHDRAHTTHHIEPVAGAGVGVVADNGNSTNAPLSEASSVEDAFSNEQGGSEIPALHTPNSDGVVVVGDKLFTTIGVIAATLVVLLHLVGVGTIGLVTGKLARQRSHRERSNTLSLVNPHGVQVEVDMALAQVFHHRHHVTKILYFYQLVKKKVAGTMPATVTGSCVVSKGSGR